MTQHKAQSGKPSAEAQISGLLFAVLLLDADLRIAEANHAAEEMLGRSIKRLIGLSFVEASGLDAATVAKLVGSDSQLVARGIPLESSGGDHRVNITISPLATHQDWRVVTLSGAGKDDMRQDSDAQAALKAPAILAHEIKNPLAAIKGASQLLAKKLGGNDNGMTTMIVDEVDRIARLVDRMQELGSSSKEPAMPVNLHQSVRKAMASMRTAMSGEIELVERFDPSLPPVLVHQDSLEQVLVNLLANAVDACANAKEPCVTVRTRFTSGLATNARATGQSVRLPVEIAVCDNGAGIAADMADHIFEPFVTSKPNGQGLGLALVKKLMADMGGRVSHLRDRATGTTEFRLHLALSE